jgi:hypothetical protein
VNRIPVKTEYNLQFGKIAWKNARYFRGKIDEIRIAGTARSSDWIKLCFMNQKQRGLLVEFKESHSSER